MAEEHSAASQMKRMRNPGTEFDSASSMPLAKNGGRPTQDASLVDVSLATDRPPGFHPTRLRLLVASVALGGAAECISGQNYMRWKATTLTQGGNQPGISERYTFCVSIATLYALATGTLYLFGYWSSFDVNFLQYVGLQEIVKATIYPTLSTFAFFTFGAFLSDYTPRIPTVSQTNHEQSRTKCFLYKFGTLLFYFFCAIAVLALLLSPFSWLLFAIILGLPLSFMLYQTNILRSVIRVERDRKFFLYLVATLPPFAFGMGKVNSGLVLKGHTFQYLVSPLEGIEVSKDDDPQHRLRFVGQTSDYVFLFNPKDNSVIITRFDTAKLLVLRNYKRPGNNPFALSNTNKPGLP